MPDKLSANNQTCEDLLTHLVEVCQTATDEKSVKCVGEKEANWEDGTIVTLEAPSLMTLAEEKHKSMKLKNARNGTSKEEANIIAMKAEIQETTELVSSPRKRRQRKEA